MFCFVLMKVLLRNAIRKSTFKHNLESNYYFRFDGKKFLRASESNFDHRHTVGLGNYMGKAFVTGCDGQECGVKTEFMDMTTLEWSNGPDYPFAAS